MGACRSSLFKYKETSAMPSRALESEPEKITSSAFLPRSVFMLCSPNTQRAASAMLDLPEPLGPTIAVIPCPNSKVVRVAKLLKPWTSSRFRYMAASAGGGQCLQGLTRGGQLRLLLVPPLAAAEHLAVDDHIHGRRL